MKVGQRYTARGTSAQIIVVRGTSDEVEVTLAGESVVALDPTAPSSGDAATDVAERDLLQVGKRYVDEESGLELICTTAGLGPVAVDGRPMTTAEAKLLPSSD